MVQFVQILICYLAVLGHVHFGAAQSGFTKRQLEAIDLKLHFLEKEPQGSKERALAQEKLAVAYSELGAMEESARYFEMAGKTLDEYGQPSKESYFNAGMTYLQIRSYAKAEKALRKCIKIEPLFRPAHIKLASLYRDTGNTQKIQKHLQYAIQISPNTPDAYMYLADTYNNLKQFKLALEQYEKALALSGHPDAIATIACSMGDAYMNLKKTSSALKAYTRGKRQTQASASALSCPTIGYLYAAMELGLWEDYESAEYHAMEVARGALKMGPQAPPTAQTPYRLLFHAEPALSLVTAIKWSSALMAQVEPRPPKKEKEKAPVLDTTDDSDDSGDNNSDNNSDSDSEVIGKVEEDVDLPESTSPPRKLNIGYMSRRYHNYPGTQLMLRLFSAHNRTAVSVSAFSTGPDDNDKVRYREVIRRDVDSFHDILDMPPNDAADLIIAAAGSGVDGEVESGTGVDVLVDYDGSHDFNNLKLLRAIRNAATATTPSSSSRLVVATWLGFASTTGPAPIDFLMADAIVLPPDSPVGRACTEYLVYLPGGCYQPQDEYQASKREMLRVMHADMSSSSDSSSIWVACLNRISKITPTALLSYLQLLAEVPRAKLVLLEDEEEVNTHLREQAAAHGILPSRLLFFPRATKEKYMQLLRLCDLYLDTRIYGSHTVASDAIFSGLPVLTLPGASFASRVGASLNHAAGADEMTPLSERHILLKQLHKKTSTVVRAQLQTLTHTQTLFNSTAFATGLERAYQGMHELGAYAGKGPVSHHLFFESSLRA
eukprot:GSChrysophyteH2.ASY1.ANO1.266.1 assembled CDS